jgi:DNA primase
VIGDAAVCVFNAGNVVPVIEHFLEMGLKVFIPADNDQAGWEAAQKARQAGASYAAAPDFHGQPGSDWNNYCLWRGAEHTAEPLYGA